jgi:hypothetical protein
MISWRYHLISIVAVFLALGLGLLMGTALLNDRLVENLRARTESAQQRLDEQEERNSRLSTFAQQVLPFVTEDRLLGQDVVIVTYQGADEGAVADARRALDSAGADIQAILALQQSLSADSASEQRTLSELLEIPAGATRETIVSTAAAALAERLAAGPVPGPAEEDLLGKLLSEGFVVAVDPELDTTTGIGGADQSMVFVAGSTADGEPDVADAFMPLIDEIIQRGAVLVVGERTTSTTGVVTSIRENADVVGPLVTVDDIDLPEGAAALVLGLERAIATGQGGDYGFGQGAQMLPAAA